MHVVSNKEYYSHIHSILHHHTHMTNLRSLTWSLPSSSLSVSAFFRKKLTHIRKQNQLRSFFLRKYIILSPRVHFLIKIFYKGIENTRVVEKVNRKTTQSVIVVGVLQPCSDSCSLENFQFLLHGCKDASYTKLNVLYLWKKYRFRYLCWIRMNDFHKDDIILYK